MIISYDDTAAWYCILYLFRSSTKPRNSTSLRLITTTYHGSVGSSPASHRGSQDTISGPFFCDLWLTKWYYDTFFSDYLLFPSHYHSINIQYACTNPSPAIHNVNLQRPSKSHFTKRISTLPFVRCKSCPSYRHWFDHFNHLTPNGHYMGRTAQLTSRCCILYIYSTNVCTEYFKHAT